MRPSQRSSQILGLDHLEFMCYNRRVGQSLSDMLFDIGDNTMTVTYAEADFLCVGCFGWARAKTAREAYRACRAYSSPSMIKPEHRKFRIWRIADQIDQISVSEIDGSWYGTPKGGVTIPQGEKACMLVWEGNEKAKLTTIPELPTEPIA